RRPPRAAVAGALAGPARGRPRPPRPARTLGRRRGCRPRRRLPDRALPGRQRPGLLVPLDQALGGELGEPAARRPLAPALAVAARVLDQRGGLLRAQAGRLVMLVEGERATDPGDRHARPRGA